MIALIDLDSLIYTSVYKVVSVREMREALTNLSKEDAKQWLLQEVYDEGINRLENQLLQMQNYLEDIFEHEITDWELYITTCKNNFRNDIANDYKANRKKNKYVWLIREHYVFNGAFCSDTLEADDLIYDRAKELGKDNCIVISIDKDLKQIGGYYWSYYKERQKDFLGNLILDDYEQPVKDYKQREVMYIDQKEADRFLFKQMLIGDATDNIKGIKGLGEKRADKIVTTQPFIKVAREYLKRGLKEEFRVNYRLLKLGK